MTTKKRGFGLGIWVSPLAYAIKKLCCDPQLASRPRHSARWYLGRSPCQIVVSFAPALYRQT